MNRKGSLSVVGTGIHINHLSIEARDEIESAEKVFFLVADPITTVWIMKANASAESMQDCYAPGKERRISYDEMTERIMSAVREGRKVCAVFYGHPGVFVTSSHKALHQARAEGYTARMLPAISAEDCLYADLDVDPRDGCQLFEATDFLRQARKFDPRCSLVLFQVGLINDPTCNPSKGEHPGLQPLVDYLLPHYGTDHPVVLYEASQLPHGNPSIIRCTLSTIDPELLKVITTLYIYPTETDVR